MLCNRLSLWCHGLTTCLLYVSSRFSIVNWHFPLKSVGENFPGIPGAYATRNLPYLIRGPLPTRLRYCSLVLSHQYVRIAQQWRRQIIDHPLNSQSLSVADPMWRPYHGIIFRLNVPTCEWNSPVLHTGANNVELCFYRCCVWRYSSRIVSDLWRHGVLVTSLLWDSVLLFGWCMKPTGHDIKPWSPSRLDGYDVNNKSLLAYVLWQSIT